MRVSSPPSIIMTSKHHVASRGGEEGETEEKRKEVEASAAKELKKRQEHEKGCLPITKPGQAGFFVHTFNRWWWERWKALSHEYINTSNNNIMIRRASKGGWTP